MKILRARLRSSRVGPAAVPRRAVAAGVAVALLSLMLPGQVATAGKPTTTTCSLTPVLRDYTVNQGVGSYNPLTRGKETEVRLYLSKPSCASSGTSIRVTSASLTMSIATTRTTYSTLSPFTAASPASLVDYTSAPAPDAASDPKFIIPAADLAPASTTGRFTPTFTTTLTYTVGTLSAQSITLSSVAGGAPMSATVEQKTKALRILVVPMAAALTTTDASTMQAGLNSLSRMLPVPKAGGQLTGPLSSTSSVGGIRYAVNAGVASVPLDTATNKYCGNLSNFNTIKAQLAQYRNDWNAANSANTLNPDANPTADIVLGVISGAESLGSDNGCAEGVASTNSPVAWVRLIPASTTPSTAGNLMAMEVAHTFNAEGAWGDPYSPTHSKYAEADLATNRAYNITTRDFIADDRTAMKGQVTGWNQDTTVYEKQDFNFLLCRLGGQTNSDCATTGTVGTINGVANGPTFVLSGTTDNTPAGTDIVESYSNEDIAFTPQLSASDYRMEFRHGDTVKTVYVPTPFETSVHSDDAATADHIAPTGLVTVAVPFEVGSKKFRYIYDPKTPADTTDDVVLFSSQENGKPKLRSLTVSSGSADGGGDGAFVNFTNSSERYEGDPALSQDGKWLAWVEDATLTVASTADINQSASITSDLPESFVSSPAWSPDGTTLAFERDGSLYTVPVDTSGATPTIGPERQIFASSVDFAPARAANPSFSPEGARIAMDGNDGQIYTMTLDGESAPILLGRAGAFGYASDPSWSQSPGDNRIAFRVSSEVSSGIYAVDPDGTASAELLVQDVDFSAAAPSWGTDDTLAYSSGGFLRTLDPTPPSDIRIAAAETAAATDTPPAIDGQEGSYPAYVRRGVSAFVRAFPLGPEFTQSDIMLERTGGSISATGGIDPAGDGSTPDTSQQSLENLRLTLYYQCPASPERSVLALALKPTGFADVGTPQATVSFGQSFDQSELCGGQGPGTLTGVMSDFFSSEPFPGQLGFDPVIQNEDIASSPQGPVASIVSPAQGATFFDWESVALQGEGSDMSFQQLADTNLSWTVQGSSLARTANGSTVDLERLPEGDYTLTLRASDPDPATGLTNEATRTIHVVADSDRDGLSDEFENTQPCLPAGAAADGNSINSDSDGDGIPDGQDPAPCVAETPSSAAVTFNPSTLHVPSNGTSVTMYVQQNHLPSLASVVGGGVRLKTITGIPLGGVAPVALDVSNEPFATNAAWSVGGTAGVDQVGTAKFDRQLLNAFIKAKFQMGQTLKLELVGYSSVPAWTFTGTGTTTIKKG